MQNALLQTYVKKARNDIFKAKNLFPSCNICIRDVYKIWPLKELLEAFFKDCSQKNAIFFLANKLSRLVNRIT